MVSPGVPRRPSCRVAALQAAILLAGLFATAPAAGSTAAPALDGNLRYLLTLREHPEAVQAPRDGALGRAARLAAAGEVDVSLRFSGSPSAERLDALEALGVAFLRNEGRRLGSHTVFPARLPWDLLAAVAAAPDVARIESRWRPFPQPPLETARAEVQAELAWTVRDRARRFATGRGVTIANFDTGADLYHPMFWRADGDTLAWLDADRDGRFQSGVDAVDLDGDGAAGAGETLRHVRAAVFGALPHDPGSFSPGFDYLYLDADENGARDFGPSAGFGEADPAFGEPIYWPLDKDRDGTLDPGEPIVAIRSCKVRAIYQTDGTVSRRGVDLSRSEGDRYGHGTQVAGILAGGAAGLTRMAGIAPDAELLLGNNVYLDDPPFIVGLETLAAWAADEGADIMLFEDGEWVWNALDGSSNLEVMMNELAERGIAQVVPAGNLAGSRLHVQEHAAPGDSASLLLISPESPHVNELWPSLLWRGEPEDLMVTLAAPGGGTIALAGAGAYQAVGPYRVYSYLSVSPRGTSKLDVQVVNSTPGGPVHGSWRFGLRNRSLVPHEVHGYTSDNISGWLGFTFWSGGGADTLTTVTWPATADSAIAVAAYDGRPGRGRIAAYSGRGPRVDGRALPFLAAPGVEVFAPVRSQDAGEPGAFAAFGGTSAAGPFVAGALALWRQLSERPGHGPMRNFLRRGSLADENTGPVPNEAWGRGKLRIYHSFDPFAGSAGSPPEGADASDEGERDPFELRVAPNPSGGGIRAAFRLPAAGPARVEIFDPRGRRVAAFAAAGGSFEWDGRLPGGARLSPGLYLLRLSQQGVSARAKVLLSP